MERQVKWNQTSHWTILNLLPFLSLTCCLSLTPSFSQSVVNMFTRCLTDLASLPHPLFLLPHHNTHRSHTPAILSPLTISQRGLSTHRQTAAAYLFLRFPPFLYFFDSFIQKLLRTTSDTFPFLASFPSSHHSCFSWPWPFNGQVSQRTVSNIVF